MENENLSPQQSFDLISQVIQDARTKFEEDGVIYTMWGVLVIIASLGQYYLLTNGHQDINYYPYFLMPIGGVISAWYYRRKASGIKPGSKAGQIGNFNQALWITCSINILIVGFGLGYKIGIFVTPMILVILSIGLTLSGSMLKSNVLLYSGIFTNIVGIVAFFMDPIYHPLVNAVVGLIAMFIPGLFFMKKHRAKA